MRTRAVWLPARRWHRALVMLAQDRLEDRDKTRHRPPHAGSAGPARVHGVELAARTGEFVAPALGQHHLRAFGQAVCTHAQVTVTADVETSHHHGVVVHAARRGFDHRRVVFQHVAVEQFTAEQIVAQHIGREGKFEAFPGQGLVALLDAYVVHQHVDATAARLQTLDQFPGFVLQRKISHLGDELVWVFGGLGKRLEFACVACSHDDGGAAIDSRSGRRPADPFRAAGDQPSLAREVLP